MGSEIRTPGSVPGSGPCQAARRARRISAPSLLLSTKRGWEASLGFATILTQRTRHHGCIKHLQEESSRAGAAVVGDCKSIGAHEADLADGEGVRLCSGGKASTEATSDKTPCADERRAEPPRRGCCRRARRPSAAPVMLARICPVGQPHLSCAPRRGQVSITQDLAKSYYRDRAGKRQLLCTYFVLVPQAMEGKRQLGISLKLSFCLGSSHTKLQFSLRFNFLKCYSN